MAVMVSRPHRVQAVADACCGVDVTRYHRATGVPYLRRRDSGAGNMISEGRGNSQSHAR